MTRHPAHPSSTPDSNSGVGSRVRAHSLVVSLLIAIVILTLGDELALRLALADGPTASDPVPAGPSLLASPSVEPTPTPLPTPVPDSRPQVLYAAGDLADCPGSGPAVAGLLRDSQSPILAVGDIVHPHGTAREYTRCFDPAWGDLKARTRPVPGNHDYSSGDASAYFAYFGSLAGNPSQGYYSFDLGWWHIIAINSVCPAIGGCRERSPQILWLRADLAAHPSHCTLAYWHHPRFSSGNGAAEPRTDSLWQVLYAAGADVILNGHDHDYERFAPMDPTGRADPERGIRQFVVGTGGANLTARERVAANSEIWSGDHHGVLELTLRPGEYGWRFVSAGTGEVIDEGTGSCHLSPVPKPIDR
jgi:3',5'-cyclic AMP phosphodiesterase CpdA